jgi:cell division septation protein DedD
MSSMETINLEVQPSPEIPANTAQNQAKRVFIAIAATITVGLTLAGWYLGGRIFASEKVHAAAISKPAAAAPVIAKTIEAIPVVEPVIVAADVAAETPKLAADVAAETPKPAADAPPVWNTVDPQSGEFYLQLAAMGPNSTNEYLKMLDAKGIHPRIAPGPSESLHRLVIGPYPDKAALEKEQQELQAAGIQFMARRY